jgi:hypothetical protein
MTAANTDKIRKSTNNFNTTLSSSINNTDTTMTLATVTGLDTANAIDLVIDRVDANGNRTPAKREYIVGVVAGSTITSMIRAKGGSTALTHASGAIVEAVANAQVQNDLADALTTTLNQDGSLKSSLSITAPSITTPTLTTPKVVTSINDTSGNELISVTSTASAVNQVNVTNSATGTGPTISAVGGDTNIDLKLNSKGTGKIDFGTTGLSNGIQTQANAGSAGGTIYYINLGGIKMAWGTTGSLSISGAAPASSAAYVITWPTSFFSTIQSATVSAVSGTSSSTQYVYAAPDTVVTATSWTFFLVESNGTNGVTSQASFFAIGT